MADEPEQPPPFDGGPIPLSYFRPLKNVRGETPSGFTMIARPIVDPVHSDSEGVRPPPPSFP